MQTSTSASKAVEWMSTTREDGRPVERIRATIPAEWVQQVEGLGGPADQKGLREFTKTTEAETVALIHGSDRAQSALAEDLVENVDPV